MALRFAILTAGNIASHMAGTIGRMRGEGIVPYAVAARDLARAQAFAEKYGIEKAYGSYEEAFADPDVDIVYVGSPHSHHYAQVKAALEHGKHVLCEKPLAPNAALAAELFGLAEEKGLLLTEATWTRYLPYVPALQACLRSGAIGTVRGMVCTFGSAVTHRERMLKPELAGGALLDLGIYPLTMAAIAFGQEVASLTGACTKTDLGVDGQIAVSLAFAGGQVASLLSSMYLPLANEAVIWGDEGRITVPEFWRGQGFTLTKADGESEEHPFPFDYTGYEYEVRSAARAIREGKCECPELPHAESLRILRQMDALRAQWGIRYPFETA